MSNSKQSQGPIIWLALEATLSVLRILIWASNPGFDEATRVSVGLKLAEFPPLVTMEKDVDVLKDTGNILDLVPERQFLEIPYTGNDGEYSIVFHRNSRGNT